MAGVPYLIGIQKSDQLQEFGGFLLNPIDGHSYLAKMQQGYQGGWRFTLPYTAAPGKGAYLFLFYIALGHLARWLNLSLLAVFHASRILGGIFLLYAIYRLAVNLYSEGWQRKVFILLAAVGSGIGWLAVFWGMFTSDFWVAEAYPFLSIYANPHFPLGMALMVVALTPVRNNKFFINLIAGGLLAVIHPFAVIIVGLVKIAEILLFAIQYRKKFQELLADHHLINLVGFGLISSPVLLYQYWSIMSDPVLSAWNTQNITPTPSPADILISFSPSLILAIFGISGAWKSESGKKMVLWAGFGLILVLIPWNLQRRFLTGIYLPLAGLAVWGLDWLKEKMALRSSLWVGMIFIFALPTNFIVIISGVNAALNQDPQVYLDACILRSLEWLSENSEKDDLVLAEPETGLLVPHLTGLRVIYGHPFETISADQELADLEKFIFQQPGARFYQEYVSARDIDYVFLSHKPNSQLSSWLEETGTLVISDASCTVYHGFKND
jgi:hypothetical protein